MSKRKPKHKTWHSADALPADDGRSIVYCGCECGWHDEVDVTGKNWAQAMTEIYECRDKHEGVS